MHEHKQHKLHARKHSNVKDLVDTVINRNTEFTVFSLCMSPEHIILIIDISPLFVVISLWIMAKIVQAVNSS